MYLCICVNICVFVYLPSIKRCLANQDGWETKKLMEFCLKTLGADKKSCYWSDIRKRCKNIIVTVIIGVILVKDIKDKI